MRGTTIGVIFAVLFCATSSVCADIKVLLTWRLRGTTTEFTQSTPTTLPSGSGFNIEAIRYFSPDFTNLWEVTEAKVWVTSAADTIGEIGFVRAPGVSGDVFAFYSNLLTIKRNGANTFTPATWGGTANSTGFNVMLDLDTNDGTGSLAATTVTGNIDDIVGLKRLQTGGDLNGKVLAANASYTTDATQPFKFRSLARQAINVGTASEQEVPAFTLGLHTGAARYEATRRWSALSRSITARAQSR